MIRRNYYKQAQLSSSIKSTEAPVLRQINKLFTQFMSFTGLCTPENHPKTRQPFATNLKRLLRNAPLLFYRRMSEVGKKKEND